MAASLAARTGPHGIPSRCGSTPGCGTVTRMEFIGDILTPSGPVDACNLSESPVRADTIVILANVEGRWVVTHEAC